VPALKTQEEPTHTCYRWTIMAKEYRACWSHLSDKSQEQSRNYEQHHKPDLFHLWGFFHQSRQLEE